MAGSSWRAARCAEANNVVPTTCSTTSATCHQQSSKRRRSAHRGTSVRRTRAHAALTTRHSTPHMATKKASPSWTDVKARLADYDRAGLLGLVQDLYAGSKDNQAFLHARLQLGEDVLEPYKAAMDRWLWPDVFKNQDTSAAKAKKAIADYKKASG